MKRRIRTIFLLMTLCILGINGFQAYWLYTTWQVTAQQFRRTVREALFDVLREQQVDQARRLFHDEAGSGSSPRRVIVRQFDNDDHDSGHNRIILFAGNPAAPAESLRRTTRTENVIVTTTRAPRLHAADTLARSISRLLISDWATGGQPVNMQRLTAAYRKELRARDTDVAFQLDTLTFRAQARHAGVQIVRVPPAGSPQPRAAYQTPPVPLNPVRGLYARATFPAATGYVLRRMGGLLAGSVALLGLTTGCFMLMLTTILRQKKLSEIKSDFISNMTHELKTPIATVSAAVEALQDFGVLHDPQKTATYLSISRQELQRLADLVEKVLQMATEEHQAPALRPEPLRPAAIIDALVARHRLKAPKPVHFIVEVASDDSITADPLHLTNVVNNLIDNAVKYSGEQVTITIRAERDAAHWRLTVADDGLGIPRHYQEAIFDRFFRVPTGNLHPVKGFGLGLYYARQVLERQGGMLTVRSEPGRGSAFTLFLPHSAAS